MSFSFVVENGVGDPDANSYVTEDYANDYFAVNSYVSDTWAALDDDQKQKLLVRASKSLDAIMLWSGTRVDDESGLRWPRTGAFDADGFQIPDDVIPPILMDGVCEWASYLMTSDWTSPQPQRGLNRIEVDVIKIVYDDSYVRPSLPDYIIAMLSCIGLVNKGVRPAFKKIIRS